MTSLKQEIEEILTTIVAPEHPWFNPDKAVTQATQSILQTIRKHLPEKKRKMSYAEAAKDFKLMEIATQNHGWNLAIDEITKVLEEG